MNKLSCACVVNMTFLILDMISSYNHDYLTYTKRHPILAVM